MSGDIEENGEKVNPLSCGLTDSVGVVQCAASSVVQRTLEVCLHFLHVYSQELGV
jgi:hypothetical protein